MPLIFGVKLFGKQSLQLRLNIKTRKLGCLVLVVPVKMKSSTQQSLTIYTGLLDALVWVR